MNNNIIKMKKIFLLSLVLSAFQFVSAQVNPGASCAQAGCTTSGSYQNLSGVPSMGSYQCLGSTPNANWLALGIATNGSVHLTLTQVTNAGNPIDVDFALYGPYTSVAAGCPIGPATPTVDCSYSGSATEYVDIANAVVGQVYILLVTNFNGQAGTISLVPNANQPSTGSVNCAINFSATTTQTSATCGQATGTATVTPVGGYAPYTYSWNSPGNPTTQTATGLTPGTYTCTITSSPNPTTGQTVNPTTASVTVLNINAIYTATSVPASCANGNNGSATANFNISGGIAGITATYLWNDPAGQTTQTATGLTPGSYSCAITLSNGCSGTANVVVGASPVAYSGTTTIVSCPGGSDGTATAIMTPVVGTLSYLWSDPAAQNTATATGLAAGTYTCAVSSTIGCTGTVNVTVTEIPGMEAVIANQTDVTCSAGNDGMIDIDVTQGTPGYTYSWDNSSSTTDVANDLLVGTHTVTITDALGCVIDVTATLAEPARLAIVTVTPDTQICPEAEITLTVAGTGGSSPYLYSWFENGVAIGTGSSITVNPTNTNTDYCVILSEQCGSPTTDTCSRIYFPTPIEPILTPDKFEACMPGTFAFSNTSDNGVEIATMDIIFSEGSSYTANGTDGVTHTFDVPNFYSVNLTATSIYGCVYTADITNIVRVKPLPVADFTFSANPATIFETSILMQDRSSFDVISWEWFSPGSTPSYSYLENPQFFFPEEVGTYPVTLLVTTELGCTDTVTLEMNIIPAILFYAPNTFTPDNDEFNNSWEFFVSGIDDYNFELYIFNRWGEMIWETHDPKSKWDGSYGGRPIQEGTYTWKATVKEPYNDGKHEFQGFINILR